MKSKYGPEPKYSANLSRRSAIRRGEQELNLNPAHLPSEDEIMDYPTRHTRLLNRMLRAQAKIRKAIAEYGKQEA